MLRTSLYFLGVGFLCLLLSDIEISTLDPWGEIQRLLSGIITPDFWVLYEFRTAFLNTLIFALCGISLSVLFGTFLAFFFKYHIVRLFCAFIRAIHEIFWAFILLPIVGLNPVCGVLAIAIPYTGIFAKVYSEILQEADQKPLKALPTHTGPLGKFFYGIFPVIIEDVKHYTSYRFECALRSSAVLGFIGLPTLGFHLETAFRESLYSEAAAILIIFYLLIASLKYWLKARLVPIYVIAAFLLISTETSFSWDNVTRFFTYDILPWPMRREGFLDGSYAIAFPIQQIWQWTWDILKSEAIPGIWHTVILTQIVLVGTGLFTLIGFPIGSQHFCMPAICRIVRYLLIIIRTTPEYIMAYVLVQLMGPSMLPAILAITFHNGGILSHLMVKTADRVKLRIDASKKRMNRYTYEILPRVYGQFLAFLFYRWEVMMRESAILGILGIFTLGFLIDSAIADDKMDKAILLILITAVLNIGIDTISQLVRKRLKISAKLETSY